MKPGKKTVLYAVLLLATAAACISESDNPLIIPNAISPNSVTVETGYTPGPPYEGPGSINPYLGEYSAFTLHWGAVENASYYEVRASEEPITTDNWDEALPMEIIPAPADSGLAFNFIEVQTEPCIGCGLCENQCPNDAITVQGGVAVIDYDRCTSCGLCQDVCPVDAITGTRNGTEYYFGVRAFFEGDLPAEDISVTEGAYKIIYFNSFGSYWLPQAKNCGLCPPQGDSLGCFGGCHILEDWADEDRTVYTGSGCPYDAIWQDTVGAGPVNFMVYIDYDLCENCGKCFVECWNYNAVIDPTENYQGLRSVMHRVVDAGWMSEQPTRP